MYALHIFYTQGQQRNVSLGDREQNDSHTIVLAAASCISISDRRDPSNFNPLALELDI